MESEVKGRRITQNHQLGPIAHYLKLPYTGMGEGPHHSTRPRADGHGQHHTWEGGEGGGHSIILRIVFINGRMEHIKHV